MQSETTSDAEIGHVVMGTPYVQGQGTKLAGLILRAVLLVLVPACDTLPADHLIYLLDVGPNAGPHLFARAGSERKPVLFRTERVRAGMGHEIVPESLHMNVPLRLPPGVSLTPDVSVDALTKAGMSFRVRAASVSPPAGADLPSVRLDFSPRQVGERVLYVLSATKHPPPGQRERTLGPVRVPHGAVLRLTMAFEKLVATEDPVTEFAVAAVSKNRARRLYTRRLDPRSVADRWVPAELPLAAVAGQEVSFRFSVRAADPADESRRLHALWGDPFIVVERSYSPETPNIILLSLDTLGARHVSAYGYDHPTSPHLDALAEQGTLFERAVCHYPSTGASHMTLFTSLLPAAHDVRVPFDVLHEAVPTLAEILRQAGYMNAAVTEDGLLSSQMGFTRGFHAYWENVRDPGRSTVAGLYEGTDGFARETIKRGLRWLRSSPSEPFFLFLHTYEVHAPYRPAKGYEKLVHPGGGPGREGAKSRAYDAEVRFLDRVVKHFVTRLERSGTLDRTLLVITSDHGEAFGEHGHWGHGRRLYDEVMHVPLIMRGPGVPRGYRVGARVGLVDIMPTILDLVGVPLPDSRVEGRSLVPYLRGDTLPERPLTAEVEGRPHDPDLRAVWLGDHKAIYDTRKGTWQVYDLAQDAGEQRDRSADAADVIAAATRILLHGHGGQKPAAAAHGSAAAPEPPTPEVLEKLQALGYIE